MVQEYLDPKAAEQGLKAAGIESFTDAGGQPLDIKQLAGDIVKDAKHHAQHQNTQRTR